MTLRQMIDDARMLLENWRPNGAITPEVLDELKDALRELEGLDQIPTTQPEFMALARKTLGPTRTGGTLWRATDQPHPLRLAIYAVLWCACKDNAHYQDVVDARLRWAQETIAAAYQIHSGRAA